MAERRRHAPRAPWYRPNVDPKVQATIVQLVLTLVPMILSLTVHECAHAWSAYKLGDHTAKDEGRLTLNPIVHIDPIGTLLFPTIGVLTNGFGLLGWARPTPFRADQMRPGVNRRLGGAIVSAAGPLSNLILATLSIGTLVLLARLGVSLHDHEHRPTPVLMLLDRMFELNVALTVFNLLPFPPLDGHRLLPPLFDPIIVPLQRYGFLILFALFFFASSFAPAAMVVDLIITRPIHWLSETLKSLFGVEG
jgi:Zn-dependent protease